MKIRSAILTAALWQATLGTGWAVDIVRMTSLAGKSRPTVRGRITAQNDFEVTVEQAGKSRAVPVNQILSIRYDNEPASLSTVRTAIDAGRYEDALEVLQRLPLGTSPRVELKRDFDFYKALSTARLALAGKADVKEAGRMMGGFLAVDGRSFPEAKPDNYHYLQACEVVGELLIADGQYSLAESYFARLAKAPWPDYKMRASVAVGRARLAAGKPAEALEAFQAALDNDAEGAPEELQRIAAALGKIRCLTAQENFDEAVELAHGILDKAEPEQPAVCARAYNALGSAHRKAGRAKDAILAFLHVDMIYFASEPEHIEALENLNALWTQIQKPIRAAEAAKTLKERYNVEPAGP